MKKIILSTCLAGLFFSPLTLSATETTSKIVESVRYEKIDKIAEKESLIARLISDYVKETIDTDITRAKLQNHFNSLSVEYFRNYRNETCLATDGVCNDNTTGGITIELDIAFQRIILGNLLGDLTTLSSQEIDYFQNGTTQRSVYAEDSIDGASSSFKFVYFQGLRDTITTIENASTSTGSTLSLTEPADTTKVWEKPNGDGTFSYYIYDTTTNTWVKKGETSLDGGGDGGTSSIELTFYKTDGFTAEGTVGQKGWNAIVQTDDGWLKYTHDGDLWVAHITGGSDGGGLFDGTGDVTAMATTLFSKAGGSIVDSQSPNGEWAGSKTFSKKDDTATGGYWKTDDNAFAVTNTIDSLNTLSPLFLNGTIAWIAKEGGGIHKLQKKTLPDFSEAWVYIATDYGDALSYDTAPSSNNDGAHIYVADHNEYLYYSAGIFTPHPSGAGITYLTKVPSGRDIFIPSSGNTYLIQTNDCDEFTCNGDMTQNYYAGSQIDGLYAYYYSTSGNNKNSLIDASPYTAWTTFWNDEAGAAQWNGTQYGEVPTGAILVKDTLNGSIVYSYNGNFINKSNGFIIPQNKLPSGLRADTITITQNSGTSYVNVSNLDTFILDTNLDVGYTVNLTGSGFTNRRITRCSNLGTNSQWSDNCSNIPGSTLAITDGSRSDLTAPSSGVRVNLTKNVGAEPNYTSAGITYTADAGYKQWFYSTSGTITQNMLDAIIPTATYATANQGTGVTGYTTASINAYRDTTATSVGYALLNGIVAQFDGTYWKPITDSTKILSGDFLVQFSTTTSNIGGVSGNGLIYTDTNTPFNATYRIDTQFGVTSWSTATMTSVNDRWNASNICRSRGMLLPRLDETTGSSNPWGGTTYVPSGGSMGNTNGVPSHPSGNTWTTTSFTGGTNAYWIWSGTSTNFGSDTGGRYVRCVR